jgi:hypothetical protein
MGENDTASHLADRLIRLFLDVVESKMDVACNQQLIEPTQHHPTTAY